MPMTGWSFPWSRRTEPPQAATGSITSRSTSTVYVRTGQSSSELGRLTSTPSIVKRSGRETMARRRRTSPDWTRCAGLFSAPSPMKTAGPAALRGWPLTGVLACARREQRQELCRVRRAESGHRIPAGAGVEAVAAELGYVVVADGDVVQGRGVVLL